MDRIRSFITKYCPLSLRDWIIFSISMAAGSLVCIFLQRITTTDTHVPIIFVLVVLVTALMTNGYFYGILASLTSVFAVNWAFTYPYMKLDFSVIGYPLTFITMLGVSIAASMLTTGMKEIEKFRRENEREKMRANLLRSVSHDLRTPLTAIDGSITAVLERKDMDEESKRELLENARNDAEWLCKMVENLLSVTKISGSATLHKTEELIEDVVGESLVNFRKNHPDLIIDVGLPDEPVFAPMDAMLIEQVIRNLMDNAVIHGKTTTRISVGMADNGDHVSVTISDNGLGIEPSILPHLFDGSLEPGKDSGDSSRFMGIGLAVCRTIVVAHGGDLTAYNNENGGASFSFSLPKGESAIDCQG